MEENIKQLRDQDQQAELVKEVKEVVGTTAVVVEPAVVEPPVADKPEAGRDKKRSSHRGGGDNRRGRGGRRNDREENDGFEQKIVDLARVTRVMAGGKRMRFRACVAVGDRKGQIALGLAKGRDVSMAINKAVTQAKKDIITLTFPRQTIRHQVREKFKAVEVLLKPAPRGKGVVAGGSVRIMLELAGVPNVVAKTFGGGNKVTTAKAALVALRLLAEYDVMHPAKKKKEKEKAIIVSE